jgi:hypothetical protein
MRASVVMRWPSRARVLEHAGLPVSAGRAGGQARIESPGAASYQTWQNPPYETAGTC